MSGRLIVFEGIEGSGKTTQLQQLERSLLADRYVQDLCQQQRLAGIVRSREPGGTRLGHHIRQLLLQPDAEVATPSSRTELLLYAADRAQHVSELLYPKLQAGYLVLCDRFTDSTVAYQGYGRQLDLGVIDQLNHIATGGLTSDLTVWLRLDAAAGLARTRGRGPADRIEQSGLAFHQRVQQGFETLARQYPERFATIDADRSVSDISAQIFAVVTDRLVQWYPPRSV